MEGAFAWILLGSYDISKGKEKKRKCFIPLHVFTAAAVDACWCLGAAHTSSSTCHGFRYSVCLSVFPTRVRVFLGQGHCFIFKSWQPHLVGVGPWAISLFIPSLGFLICKMGMIIIVPTSECHFEDQSMSNEYTMNEVHFPSIFIPFQEVQARWC